MNALVDLAVSSICFLLDSVRANRHARSLRVSGEDGGAVRPRYKVVANTQTPLSPVFSLSPSSRFLHTLPVPSSIYAMVVPSLTLLSSVALSFASRFIVGANGLAIYVMGPSGESIIRRSRRGNAANVRPSSSCLQPQPLHIWRHPPRDSDKDRPERRKLVRQPRQLVHQLHRRQWRVQCGAVDPAAVQDRSVVHRRGHLSDGQYRGTEPAYRSGIRRRELHLHLAGAVDGHAQDRPDLVRRRRPLERWAGHRAGRNAHCHPLRCVIVSPFPRPHALIGAS
jgi:hypothetical protein